MFYDSDLKVSYMGFGTIEKYKKRWFKVTLKATLLRLRSKIN
jgi:hypothetical protein